MDERNPNYTFEAFIVGSSNQESHAACYAAATGICPNPVFIHGPSGSGKTHLLTATASRLLESAASRIIRCRSTEAFVNALREPHFQGDMSRFRAGVRKIDALLLDDVHILEARRWAHQEFVSTLKDLRAAGKLIVLASLTPAREISFGETLLRALPDVTVSELDALDPAVKLTLLHRRAAIECFNLPDEVAEYLAENNNLTNAQVLGVLSTIIARCRATSEVPNEVMAHSLVSRLSPRYSIQKITRVVSKHLGATRADMSRKRHSRARDVVMYLAAEAGIPISQIACEMKCDRSTAKHAAKRIGHLLTQDRELETTVLQISEELDR